MGDIKSLSKKLLGLLKDRRSEVYRENVTKFGIPEEYVNKAFSEEELVSSAASVKIDCLPCISRKARYCGFRPDHAPRQRLC